MDVVEAIGDVETDANDEPTSEITIDRIEIHD
jgi:peptidyl-prolyl cis-trans isomerase A (cyclophilin A)